MATDQIGRLLEQLHHSSYRQGGPGTTDGELLERFLASRDESAFETLVQGWPEVRECHMLAGEADFLLKIVTVDWDVYQRFLTTQLTAAPNVSHVKSALAIRTAKSAPGVPISAG